MTDDTLRELLAKATGGNWRWSENGNIVTDAPNDGCDPEIAAVYTEHDDDTLPANAALILAMKAELPALLADRAERDTLQARLAASERREKVAQEYVKKLDGIIEEVGGVTASCINPYEDLKRALQGQKARAEKAEAELAALREAVSALAEKWRNESKAGDQSATAEQQDVGYQMGLEGCADDLEALLPASVRGEVEGG